eukprot:9492092-Pyramimonas_sp.AAC.3
MSTNERLKKHPLVTSGPQLRTYLGVRLRCADMNTIGALSVFGVNANHTYSTEDIEVITELGKMLEHVLSRQMWEKQEIKECRRVRAPPLLFHPPGA